MKKVFSYVLLLSLFCASNVLAFTVTNNSFEDAIGAAPVVTNNWAAYGLAYRGQEGTGGYLANAQDGEYMILTNINAGNQFNGVYSNFYAYATNDLIDYSGYFYLTEALPANHYTRLQIEFADASGTTLEWDNGTNETATGSWFQSTMQGQSANPAVTQYKLVINSGFDSGGQTVTEKIYWDNVAATPEPSTYALFGLGFLGLVGAGLRRRFSKK